MFLRINLIVALFLSFNFSNYAQFRSNKKVFIGMDDIRKGTIDTLMGMNNVAKCKIVYGEFLYPNDSKTLSEATFTKEFTRLFPNKNDSGYALFDWEGELYNTLVKDDASEDMRIQASNEFLKTIYLAKQLRPNVKVSFYGIPYPGLMEYKYITKKYMLMILNKSDFIVPLYYLTSETDKVEHKLMRTVSFFKNKMRNKPIYPIIWDRYSASNANLKHKQIPSEKFIPFVNKILNNPRINGVIYWGRETYFFNADRDFGSKDSNLELADKYNKRLIKNFKALCS